MNNPINDKDFLKKLDLVRNKKTYIKIYSLNFKEEPRECIEGKVTAGSINIDGTSAVRRTCSLTLVSDNLNINDYLWGLNTKIKIFIGVENTIDDTYEDIIWFNQGIYVLTAFSVSYTTSSYTINISGQDKMCLLNGSIGGTLPASIDFQKETVNKTVYETVDLGPVYVKNQYYYPDESARVYYLASDDFDSTADYYVKQYDTYTLVGTISEEDFFPDTYYYQQSEDDLYVLLTSEQLDTAVANKERIYQKISDEYILYTYEYNQYINGEMTFYKNNRFQPIGEEDDFLTFTQYYYYKDNYFYEVLLDEATFKLNRDSTQYYVDTLYVLADEYTDGQIYYTVEDGKYVQTTAVTNYNYQINTYYTFTDYKFILAEDNFDSSKSYYELKNDGIYYPIDFLETAKTKYTANKYYLNVVDDFVLSDTEYNPQRIYYTPVVYSDTSDIPIKTIIKEAIHTYAQEPYYNIIINDVDDYGLYLKEYRGDDPIYILVNEGISENNEKINVCKNLLLNGDTECYVIPESSDLTTLNTYIELIQDELTRIYNQYNVNQIDALKYEALHEDIFKLFLELTKAQLTTINDTDNIIYDTNMDDFNINPSRICFFDDTTIELIIYTVIKLEYGDTAGYELTELTYPGELISSLGDSLVTILDKIKNQFSDFEYFYDVDGHFVFQKKKTYLNTSWNNIITSEGETFATSAVDTSAIQYTFEDNDLIISITNTPKLDNLKNDYSVWGTRKTVNDVEVPIHARFAIDTKPFAYVTFPKTQFNAVSQSNEIIVNKQNDLEYLVQEIYVNQDYEDIIIVDDYITDENDEQELKYKIRIEPTVYNDVMYAGICFKYIVCDWREIIYQMSLDYYKYNQSNDFLALLAKYNTFDYNDFDIDDNLFMQKLSQYNGQLYPNGITGYEQYYTDLNEFWRELYNPEPEINLGQIGGYYENGEWVESSVDYSNFTCDYYLPEKDYTNIYLNNLTALQQNYENKLASLKLEQEELDNNPEIKELLEALNGTEDGDEGLLESLENLKYEKSLLQKSMYSQKMIAISDPEYLALQESYQEAVNEKNTAVNDLDNELMNILYNDFGLY